MTAGLRPSENGEGAGAAAESDAQRIELQADLLREIRHMNAVLRRLTSTPKRLWMAFMNGIVRGLGAAIGATVVFALLAALIARLDTVPIIGGYITEMVEFVIATGGPTLEQTLRPGTARPTDSPAPAGPTTTPPAP